MDITTWLAIASVALSVGLVAGAMWEGCRAGGSIDLRDRIARMTRERDDACRELAEAQAWLADLRRDPPPPPVPPGPARRPPLRLVLSEHPSAPGPAPPA